LFFNLFYNYYKAGTPERQAEIDWCFINNLANENWSLIFLFGTADDIASLNLSQRDLENIVCIYTPRPTFNDYFDCINEHCSGLNNINFICNSDIFIAEATLNECVPYFTTEKLPVMLALTRYDFTNKGATLKFEFFGREDSQDTWIFNGGVPNSIRCEYTQGMAGIDNHLAYLFNNNNFVVKNPSLTMRTYHFHVSEERTYLNDKGCLKDGLHIPPPYHLLPPTK